MSKIELLKNISGEDQVVFSTNSMAGVIAFILQQEGISLRIVEETIEKEEETEIGDITEAEQIIA